MKKPGGGARTGVHQMLQAAKTVWQCTESKKVAQDQYLARLF
jgi:hypothetical protein